MYVTWGSACNALRTLGWRLALLGVVGVDFDSLELKYENRLFEDPASRTFFEGLGRGGAGL